MLALQSARSGRGRVEPNPPVGACVVGGDRLLSLAHHRAYGGPHAEIHALRGAGSAARGATLYVTLEPCSTTGKTPPCVDALLAAGLARVVVATEDPNPAHRGLGLRRLQEGGVEVVRGLLSGQADELLSGFREHLASPFPFVVAKWAMSADGKIATATGDSRWITGLSARRRAHRERREADAVMVGIGTVLADDPELTVRHVRGESRIRIVLDSSLRTPPTARLVRTCHRSPVLILAGEQAPSDREEFLRACGCSVIRLPVREGRVDLKAALRLLRERGVGKILLEGGGELLADAFRIGVVKRALAFVAPKILGGREAPTPVGGRGVSGVIEGVRLSPPRVQRLGDDVLLTYQVERAGGPPA